MSESIKHSAFSEPIEKGIRILVLVCGLTIFLLPVFVFLDSLDDTPYVSPREAFKIQCRHIGGVPVAGQGYWNCMKDGQFIDTGL